MIVFHKKCLKNRTRTNAGTRPNRVIDRHTERESDRQTDRKTERETFKEFKTTLGLQNISHTTQIFSSYNSK